MKLILYLKKFKTELKIDGILSNPSEITWSIEGNKSANTTIDQKGLLQVGATEPSYVPDVTIPGTYYYYVEVTNTNESEKITGSKYASSVSDVHTIIIADVHNIVYNLNGGHLSESAPMEFNELMDEFSLENPTRDGYIFEGWYKDNVIIKPKNNYIKIAKVLDSTIDSDLTEGIISTDTGSIESDVSTYKWEDSIEIVDESENQQVSFVLLRDDGVITEIKNLDNINIDKSAPNVEININENKFNKFLNKITFGYFFKDTASVKIVSNDELSGVLKTEYQLVSNEDEFNKDGVWIE